MGTRNKAARAVDQGACKEPCPVENGSGDGFGRNNWIILVCGLTALVTGFVALGLNSTIFAPICIVAAYIAIGASLLI